MLKKRVTYHLGVSEDLPEGIFGLLKSLPTSPRGATKIKTDILRVDNVLKLEKKKRAPIVKRPAPTRASRKTKVMPDFVINYDKTLPEEASGILLDNVVNIPEELLEQITKKTQLNAKVLSRLMLLNAAPSVLSFDAASNYVRTVLDDGLGIEVEVDRGVLEVVKNLSRLDVIFFFVKRMALPIAFKRKFMHKFTEDTAVQSMALMQKTNKSDQMSSNLRELEGVLVKRSEKRAQTFKSGTGGSKVSDSDIQRVTDLLNARSAGSPLSGSTRSRLDRTTNSPAGF